MTAEPLQSEGISDHFDLLPYQVEMSAYLKGQFLDSQIRNGNAGVMSFFSKPFIDSVTTRDDIIDRYDALLKSGCLKNFSRTELELFFESSFPKLQFPTDLKLRKQLQDRMYCRFIRGLLEQGIEQIRETEIFKSIFNEEIIDFEESNDLLAFVPYQSEASLRYQKLLTEQVSDFDKVTFLKELLELTFETRDELMPVYHAIVKSKVLQTLSPEQISDILNGKAPEVLLSSLQDLQNAPQLYFFRNLMAQGVDEILQSLPVPQKIEKEDLDISQGTTEEDIKEDLQKHNSLQMEQYFRRKNRVIDALSDSIKISGRDEAQDFEIFVDEENQKITTVTSLFKGFTAFEFNAVSNKLSIQARLSFKEDESARYTMPMSEWHELRVQKEVVKSLSPSKFGLSATQQIQEVLNFVITECQEAGCEFISQFKAPKSENPSLSEQLSEMAAEESGARFRANITRVTHFTR